MSPSSLVCLAVVAAIAAEAAVMIRKNGRFRIRAVTNYFSVTGV